MTRNEIELVLYGLNRYGKVDRELTHNDSMAYAIVFTKNDFMISVWANNTSLESESFVMSADICKRNDGELVRLAESAKTDSIAIIEKVLKSYYDFIGACDVQSL